MMISHWSELPERPILAEGDCQLWMIRLDEEDPETFRELLSEEERTRAKRFCSPGSADRFTIVRGILRSLLSGYLSYRPEKLVFSYGLKGKPELTGKLSAGLTFNVSHSGRFALIAVANDCKVGVDIEEIHPVDDLEATASIFLSPEEFDEFEVLPTQKKLESFFTIWTCKEAILKAYGTGLSGSIKNILMINNQTSTTSDGHNTDFDNKRITLLNPAKGYKGALACLYQRSRENT